jgi:hypothetical protein
VDDRTQSSFCQPPLDLAPFFTESSSGKNLKNVGETMKNLKETTEAGKMIWATGVEVFKAIGPWVGLAAGLLG